MIGNRLLVSPVPPIGNVGSFSIEFNRIESTAFFNLTHGPGLTDHGFPLDKKRATVVSVKIS